MIPKCVFFFSFCHYCCSCIGWMSRNERLITSLAIWRCFIIETKAAWQCSVVYTSGILTDNFTNICPCYGCRTIFLSIIPSYFLVVHSLSFFLSEISRFFCFWFSVGYFRIVILCFFAWPFCWHFSFQFDWPFTPLSSFRFAWSFWYF